MASRKRKISSDVDKNALYKEWDQISCPICMDHPHNAVLILCSSHTKGCRSFICDTSYRHSNCLDRFKKLVSETNRTVNSTADLPNLIPANDNPVEYVEMDRGPQGFNGNNDIINDNVNVNDNDDNDDALNLRSNLCLKCPLCRGKVAGWEVVEDVRQYLNSKSRSCSQESCLFSGSYRELRRHARRAHPTARPSDVDPTRERAWRWLEHQREYGDIVSAIRSAMPGAVVFGDYAVENGDNRVLSENNRGGIAEGVNHDGHWWRTAFFLFQMIGSMEQPPADHRRGVRRTRVPTRHRRRRLLWGETLLGLQDDHNDNDDDDSDDDGDDDDDSDDGDPFALDLVDANDDDRVLSPRRRRRRLIRYRSVEDRS